jgi:hypothetical protein
MLSSLISFPCSSKKISSQGMQAIWAEVIFEIITHPMILLKLVIIFASSFLYKFWYWNNSKILNSYPNNILFSIIYLYNR